MWMPRQFMLPILIGFSLTGVGLAFLYLLYKEDDDDRKTFMETSRKTMRECKVPRQFVPIVIGRGGLTIKEVQQKTGTQINFKEDNIECPYRVCMIRGSLESVRLAEEMINNIVANQPVIEVYEMYVPHTACGRIIGRGGETIKEIQMTSSAKVMVEGNGHAAGSNADRKVTIKGTVEQIANALSQIEDKVKEEKEARSKLDASLTTRLPRGKLSPRNTAVNNTENVSSAESTSIPAVDGTMEVYVSAMETPSQFWVQLVGSGPSALDKLVSEMTLYYEDEENRELHSLKNVTVGEMVAAKFSFDERWYRAEVVSITDDGYCKVYFVDYGDHEVVELNNVLELRTDFLSLRLQAVECSLANVKSRDNEWSTEACDKFAELTWLAQWKILVAKVRGYKERTFGYGKSRREGSPIPCVELYDKNDNKDVNVGQELINEGIAESDEGPWSAASSTLSLSRRSHDVPAFSSPVPTSPLARRGESPETPANTPVLPKLIPETPTSTPLHRKITEIDLRTPQGGGARQIEEIDLVTPMKDETRRFIDNEKKLFRENGSGDHARNGSAGREKKEPQDKLKLDKFAAVAPGGYESDMSGDSDELEMG